jgi:hypothetical protein
MKTYPLYLNEAQLRLVLDLLNTAVDDVAEQITAALNGIQAESAPNFSAPRAMLARGADVQRQVAKKRKLAPVTRLQAIDRLGAAYPDAAKALVAWKNKIGGVLGWDRWIKKTYPDAARLLWSEIIAASEKRKPARHG